MGDETKDLENYFHSPLSNLLSTNKGGEIVDRRIDTWIEEVMSQSFLFPETTVCVGEESSEAKLTLAVTSD